MANALGKATEIDPEKARNGVPCEMIIGDKVFHYTVAIGGEHNKEMQTAAEKILRPYHRANLRMEQLPQKKQEEIRATLVSKYMLKGWSEEDFEEPFSEEAAYRTCMDAPEFAKKVTDDANTFENYRKTVQTDIVGN